VARARGASSTGLDGRVSGASAPQGGARSERRSSVKPALVARGASPSSRLASRQRETCSLRRAGVPGQPLCASAGRIPFVPTSIVCLTPASAAGRTAQSRSTLPRRSPTGRPAADFHGGIRRSAHHSRVARFGCGPGGGFASEGPQNDELSGTPRVLAATRGSSSSSRRVRVRPRSSRARRRLSRFGPRAGSDCLLPSRSRRAPAHGARAFCSLEDERRVRSLAVSPQVEELIGQDSAPEDELIRRERRRMERRQCENAVAAVGRAI
jgi:hypothetical protein